MSRDVPALLNHGAGRASIELANETEAFGIGIGA